ncbi:hypothetical protein SYNPS1DRAFT_30292 [Syncephalis pseudoplumigaleata]|uniref:Uncharacterized protein n=1 Tax=Syncephalis pseudoplumigaleata TaxID=1712513 RepID=A0A4P9YV57_9FUNG|nr:hypothetical protein SYNPS1DRAFT_30292 [Syncephalis pseudoplumigaleata]|eukprot:RKP23933.1 hypothetical protein SYNPS1DRAFT_30292 [Syncephalis pseudoplumigaleata]
MPPSRKWRASLVVSLLGLLLFLAGIHLFTTVPTINAADRHAQALLRMQQANGDYDLRLLNRLIEEEKRAGLFDIYADIYARPVDAASETHPEHAAFNYLLSIYETRLRSDQLAYRFRCALGWIAMLLGIAMIVAQTWLEWMNRPTPTDHHHAAAAHMKEARMSSSNDHPLESIAILAEGDEHEGLMDNHSIARSSSSSTRASIQYDMPHPYDRHCYNDALDHVPSAIHVDCNAPATMKQEASSADRRNLPEPRPICATLGTGITWTPAWLHSLERTTHSSLPIRNVT